MKSCAASNRAHPEDSALFANTGFKSPLLEDTGLDILGVTNIEGERGSVTIALGPEPAAQQFEAQLMQCVKNAQAQAGSSPR
jgi:hypothetical protein